jgi:hypothetical protein
MHIATDLHGHSHFSDGRATPEAYVDARRELGMRVVALSDHDVLAGVRRAAAAAERAQMVLLPAVEVTAFLHFGTTAAEQFHILAYFPPAVLAGPRLEATFLYRRGQRVQAAWRAFVLEWMRGLDADERRLLDPEDELEALPPAEFPALQSMIDRLAERLRPRLDAFRDHHYRFWEEGRELFAWEPEALIDAIRADGAVDIVAHPGRYRDKERTNAILERASGLEVYTSRHKAEVAAGFRAFAEERRKLWTASADDHQNARYIRPPCGTPVTTLERLMRRPVPLEWVLAA